MKKILLFVFGFIFFIIVPFFAICYNTIKKLKEGKLLSYYKSLWLAKDQYCKVALYGGNPDVTVSHQLGVKTLKKNTNWFERKICCFLKRLDNNHCKKSIEIEEL